MSVPRTRLVRRLLAALWVGLPLACALPALAFDMQSHRGGRGLRPENTLVSFENAIRMGTTTIELDIAITADGVPVISHDPALNPAYTRDAGGKFLTQHEPLIKDMTLAQVQSYDVGRLNPDHPYGKEWTEQVQMDGVRIPTLASLFKLVKDLGATDLHFDMETKINPQHPHDTLAPEPFVRKLLEVIREFDMTDRVMVQSFDWRTLEARGLDVTPAMRARFVQVGDARAADILDIILRNEIGHVAVGNRWFHWLCARDRLDPIAHGSELARRHRAPRLRPPFNRPARLAAGFTERELEQPLGWQWREQFTNVAARVAQAQNGNRRRPPPPAGPPAKPRRDPPAL